MMNSYQFDDFYQFIAFPEKKLLYILLISYFDNSLKALFFVKIKFNIFKCH
jgi:hypothetical protein